MADDEVIKKVERFLEDSFIAHPHYSFGDWKIMASHSLLVRDFALEIVEGEQLECDKLVLEVIALLHDIGKTYEATEETLHRDHEELGFVVAETFLRSLPLNQHQFALLKNFFVEQDDSIIRRIVKDADVLAFFADERLQSAFVKWAQDTGRVGELERKIAKKEMLNFAFSKRVVTPLSEQIIDRWQS